MLARPLYQIRQQVERDIVASQPPVKYEYNVLLSCNLSGAVCNQVHLGKFNAILELFLSLCN